MRPFPIEAARSHHSLIDVARRAGVDLYRTSGSTMVRCPFPSHGHFDRSPSLRLYIDDGFWHCFGCDQKGDVVEWVCQTEGVGWRQAIRILDSGRSLNRALAYIRIVCPFGWFFRPTCPGSFDAPLRAARPGRLPGLVSNASDTRLRRSDVRLDALQFRPAP